jgi:basic membrane protein A
VRLVTDTNGVNDRSLNQLAWHGLVRARKRYHITPSVTQPKKTSSYRRDLESSAQHYYQLTLTVGYGEGRILNIVAQEFPGARFMVVDGRPLDSSYHPLNRPNVASILFKEQESGYLVGVIAGLMEKERVHRAIHNIIGYIGGARIPAVEHYLAGYVAGARSVDPGIRVLGQFVGTFSSAKLGAAIASKQIGEGADILFPVAADTGLGYLQEAKIRGVYGIGVDASLSYLGPFILTSAIKKVSMVVQAEILATLQWKFRGGTFVLGAKQHATGFARPSPLVPASIVAQARRVQQQIAAGKIVPPTTIPR